MTSGIRKAFSTIQNTAARITLSICTLVLVTCSFSCRKLPLVEFYIQVHVDVVGIIFIPLLSLSPFKTDFH